MLQRMSLKYCNSYSISERRDFSKLLCALFTLCLQLLDLKRLLLMEHLSIILLKLMKINNLFLSSVVNWGCNYNVIHLADPYIVVIML